MHGLMIFTSKANILGALSTRLAVWLIVSTVFFLHEHGRDKCQSTPKLDQGEGSECTGDRLTKTTTLGWGHCGRFAPAAPEGDIRSSSHDSHPGGLVLS